MKKKNAGRKISFFWVYVLILGGLTIGLMQSCGSSSSSDSSSGTLSLKMKVNQ